MMSYRLKLLLALTVCLSGSQSFAFGNLSADEVTKIFSGNTVEGERREGGTPGIDAPNKLEDVPTRFVVYFDKNGTARKKTGNKSKPGKWSVAGDGGLCIKWKGKKEKCAPVQKSGDVYMRTITRKSGFILFESRYISFTPGNKHGL